jgi:hypothetical protein
MLNDAAKATPGELRAIQSLVSEIAGGQTVAPEANPAGDNETFATYADRWFDDRERNVHGYSGVLSLDAEATYRGRPA